MVAEAKDRSVQIVGRSSSHFTRVAQMFAIELSVPFELVPIYELGAMDSSLFGGNPALKMPALRRGESVLFGTENICRALAEMSSCGKRVVWPEELRHDVARNAQEMVWHAKAAQVQLIVGTRLAKLPADNPYFVKGRKGFVGALEYLEQHLATVLSMLPSPRDLSLFEVTLFCLVEHLQFREMVPIEPYSSLAGFAKEFGARPSARSTPYRVDVPPAA